MTKIPFLICLAVLLLFVLGTHWRNTEWSTEEKLWEATVRESPFKPRVRINLGKTYHLDGRYPEALYQYRVAHLLADEIQDPIERHMWQAMSVTNTTALLIQLGQLDTAERLLLDAWNDSPGSPQLASNLGVIYLRKGRLDDALAILDAGVRLKGQYPRELDPGHLYFNRGEVHRLMQQCPEALADYHSARLLDPDIPELACP